ncbi:MULTISPECIES: hypothetical protein [unclassified Variovorax]|uniref:hypothetical protein n=1 Tax=unclassified Variovorax TaxID=663243 RepID=UPI00076C84D7|nr:MULTISPECIES: hypothetical protein [unclassified Variovorax]KWT98677.1 hypothetical protein APY03_0260 [Variovorax sp. WDL1]PNG59405.1 hypothetical protein CHC07_01132 [Variovorax sp. B4]PNG60804.1 hypothetical protein CHC06_00703 [Variovorax sp. B2]VTV13277.1 hypothetical protein WDL1CHR_03961 [Variovorax sp. WDL1]
MYPNQHIRRARTALCLSEQETAVRANLTIYEKVGYASGFTQQVEDGSIDLLAYPIELALDLASSTRSSPFEMVNDLEQAFKKL